MSLDPLLHASPIIQLHALAATLALITGAYVLFNRKGDARHRMMGRIWVSLLVVVCISSLFIWELRMVGLFSPIHLLSLGTLYALWRAVSYARQRNITRHKRTMQLTYIGALLITGLFTFLPTRIMNRVIFGADGASMPELLAFGITIITIALATIMIARYRPARRARRQKSLAH
ncbi:DUF2306 domain-containing protein [Devosia rhodophyticola]|uniref:DUF2306 domain-containing protein n=1 Tax=Devosia rhodophyticola TaxID=3026423 RepID=A0ABY7Z1Y8_9HYPH|nr:DUF2306 domain-containing protein [Devosia rhodophyticola]WDR07119.1 DUF2306 domain-containing protein [Devosia rhodophyticola]